MSEPQKQIEDVLKWLDSLRMATTREEAWFLTNDEQPAQAYRAIRHLREALRIAEQERDQLKEANRTLSHQLDRRASGADPLTRQLIAERDALLSARDRLVQAWRKDAEANRQTVTRYDEPLSVASHAALQAIARQLDLCADALAQIGAPR
jgi:hypothetical protein